MRWLTVFCILIPAFLFSACGKPAVEEKIAVISWDKAIEGHPQQTRLRQLKEGYNLLLDRRKEQEIFSKTQMSGLARLQQLKENSKRSFLTADFQTRMAERQAVEQEKLKKAADQAGKSVEQEFSEEEKRLEEQYRLKLFNLRLKLDSLRLTDEARRLYEEELARTQAARERERAELVYRKRQRLDQLMGPEIAAMRQRMDAFARQLQAQMSESLQTGQKEGSSALQEAPAALNKALGAVDRELDSRQQAVEALEETIKKDVEGVVAKLAKERGYTIVFHKYRTNIAAEDITGDVLTELGKISAKREAADAFSKKAGSSGTGQAVK